MKNQIVENIIIKCATSNDIDTLCAFEKQARITEPGILYWDINEKEYKEKLKLMNLEKLSNTKIIIAKQDNKVSEDVILQ